MERVMRIELTQSAWKAEVLPLNYTRKYGLVGKTGFEPATSWSQTRRSTKLSYFPFSLSALVIISQHFMNAIPPRAMSSNYLQMGEPFSHRYDIDRRLRPTFMTFAKCDGIWRYCGTCFSYETINRD